MDTTLSESPFGFNKFPSNAENCGVVATRVQVLQATDTPLAQVLAEREPDEEVEQVRVPTSAAEETFGDADSEINKPIDTVSAASHPFAYTGPIGLESEAAHLYVRTQCYAPDLAPFEPRDPIT